MEYIKSETSDGYQQILLDTKAIEQSGIVGLINHHLLFPQRMKLNYSTGPAGETILHLIYLESANQEITFNYSEETQTKIFDKFQALKRWLWG